MIRRILILCLLAIMLINSCVKEEMKDASELKELEETIEKQTIIFNYLESVGISNALVDVTSQRVLIRYELPEDIEKEKTYYFAMAVSAKICPGSEDIKIEAFKEFELLETVSVKTSDVLDLVEDKTSINTFKDRIIINKN